MVSAHQKILNTVLKKIKPTKTQHEKELKKANQLIQEVKNIKGSHVDAVFCGSAARNTELKGDSDIDIFVLYPLNTDERILKTEGLNIGKTIAKQRGRIPIFMGFILRGLSLIPL